MSVPAEYRRAGKFLRRILLPDTEISIYFQDRPTRPPPRAISCRKTTTASRSPAASPAPGEPLGAGEVQEKLNIFEDGALQFDQPSE
jgi:hypothetical protein